MNSMFLVIDFTTIISFVLGGNFAASGGTLYSMEDINKVREYIDTLE